MIATVDGALRRAVRESVPDEAVTVTFEAPTKDWAARRSGPAVDVYLYDLHEVLARRHVGRLPVQDAEGRPVGVRAPQRWYALSYLLTCWTARPEDEHALLSACLVGLLRHDVLPTDWLGPGVSTVHPCELEVAQPPPTDRKSPDLWSALGGELKPSLDLTVTLALDVGTVAPLAPQVVEPPVLVARALYGGVGADEVAAGRCPD